MAQPTKEQLETALRNAHNAGDEYAARTLATAIQNGEYQSEIAPELKQELTEPSFTEQIMGGAIEPIRAMAGGTIGALSGVASSLPAWLGGDSEQAVDTLKNVESQIQDFTAPKTDAGKYVMTQLGKAAEKAGDVANVPLSYMSGFADLVTSFDPESAEETIANVQKNGFINTSLDKVEEITGSPYMRELVARAPDLIATVVPAAKIGSKKAQLNKARKKELIERLEKGDTAGELATKRVTQQPTEQVRAELGFPKVGPLQQPQQQQLIEAAAKTKRLDKFPTAKEAVRQGFDEGVVRAIATGSKSDVNNLKRMVEMRKNIVRDPVKYKNARPSDILGESVMNRVSFVRNKLKDAGKEVDIESKKLKGKPLDFGESVDQFINNLTESGVTFDNNMRPNFKGSDYAGSKASERLIKNIMGRMTQDTGKLDAYDIHRFKRMLNEWEFTGKRADGGLTKSAENTVSNLRKNLNKNLRDEYPDYGAANQVYSDLKAPLDEFLKAAKIKVDLDSNIADAAIGQEMRKLLTNYKDRLPLEKGMDEIDKVAKSLGGKFNDNIYLQTHFVNELDDVIGDVAKRSFKAEQQKSRLTPSAKEVAADKAAELVDKARGINKVNQLKAIEKYLEEIN